VTRLDWGSASYRFYEVGVDRGVLYVDGVGVAWNGLVSVTEETTGGEAKPFYIDGVKYSNRASAEEFEATLTAYTYPDEFARCDGSAQVGRGLFVTNQRRKSFGLSYRTRVGNDISADFGYKIHLIYDALAAPSQKANTTMGDELTPLNFSWKLTTRPPALTGRRATSHFIIDSRMASESLMEQLGNILYGTADEPPRLIPVDELVYLFEQDLSGTYDAGIVGQHYYNTLDGGLLTDVQTSTVDGGVA
jgi:hypothetical protein